MCYFSIAVLFCEFCLCVPSLCSVSEFCLAQFCDRFRSKAVDVRRAQQRMTESAGIASACIVKEDDDEARSTR